MNILVCVKQVNDPAAGGSRMNRFDECALEEALRLHQGMGGSVDAISLGPEDSAQVLRRAMGMGASRGIHILAPHPDVDPFVTAQRIADRAGQGTYDLILTGAMSEDAMGAQVGPLIAGMLGWPCAAFVVEIRMGSDPDRITVTQELEGGRRLVLTIGLPAVLTVQLGANTPRYPTLTHMLRAGRQPLETVAADQGMVVVPRQVLHDVRPAPRKRNATVLEGGLEAKAEALVAILAEKGFVP